MDATQGVSVNKADQTNEKLTNGPPSLGGRLITNLQNDPYKQTATTKTTAGLDKPLKPGPLLLTRMASSRIYDDFEQDITFPGPFSYNPKGISFPGTKEAPERKRLTTEMNTPPPPGSSNRLTRQQSIYPEYDPRSRMQRHNSLSSHIITIMDNEKGYASSSEEEDIIDKTENTPKPSRTSTLNFVKALPEETKIKLLNEIIDRATNKNNTNTDQCMDPPPKKPPEFS